VGGAAALLVSPRPALGWLGPTRCACPRPRRRASTCCPAAASPRRNGALLSPQQQAQLAATLLGTLRIQGAALPVGHCKRLLRQLVRLPLLPASKLLSLLAEEEWEVVEGVEGAEQEGAQRPPGPAAGAARGLPEAVQELVMEALTRLDDQQQVQRWVPACVVVRLAAWLTGCG
jgi:hypothetical protein